MLWKMRKVVLMLTVAVLPACARLSGSPNNLADIAFVDPLAQRKFVEQNLLSFDLYADQGVLHAVFAVATGKPKQPYIGYLHSDDGGLNWSEPNEIGQSAAETVESAAGNDVQVAAFGPTLMAIWQVTGELPGMGPLRVVYSPDGGQSWLPGANPTATEIDQSHPDLAADQAGRFHLAWLDDRDENGHQGVRYARSFDAGLHWELAQTVDDSSCSCCWNRLSIDQEGVVNVLYRDMEPRDMALAQSFDAGQTWQRTATVGEFNWIFDGCPHNGGGLASAGAQTLHGLVWSGAERKAGLYYLRSSDNGKNWSQPQAMGGDALAFHSDIAVRDGGRLLAIWDAAGADGSVVMISESFDSGGHWSNPRRISAPGSSAGFPRVVATQSGWLAMWTEQKTGAVKKWVSAVLK